jgi:thiol:disulfide interchange protein DsbD
MGLKRFLLVNLVILGAMSAKVTASEFQLVPQNGALGVADILPVDEAFVLQVVRREGILEVLWQIQPRHYLYRHRLSVRGSERLGEPQVPAGLAKTDEFFGDVEVYYEGLEVRVPLQGDKRETIVVEYQGCADAGVCYPPQKREFTL